MGIGDNSQRSQAETTIVEKPLINANGGGVIAAYECGKSPPRGFGKRLSHDAAYDRCEKEAQGVGNGKVQQPVSEPIGPHP